MLYFFCVKQKTVYEMRISDGSSDVCASDLMDVFAIATRTAPLLRSGRGRRAAPGEGSAFRGDLTHPHPNHSPASQERGQGCASPAATLCYPSPDGASGHPVPLE